MNTEKHFSYLFSPYRDHGISPVLVLRRSLREIPKYQVQQGHPDARDTLFGFHILRRKIYGSIKYVVIVRAINSLIPRSTLEK